MKKGTDASLIRWGSQERKREIASLAKCQGKSVNGLVNTWAEIVLAQTQAEASFRATASRGKPARLIALLEKMDRDEARKGLADTQP